MSTFNSWYEDQLERGEIPDALQVQPAMLEIPQMGMSFVILATWTGADADEGHDWIKKVASVQPCIMEQTQALPLAEYLENNEKLIMYPSYGKSFTVSLRRLTPEAIIALSNFSKIAPGGSMSFSVHTLRFDCPSEVSAFSSREAHHMIEIMGLSGDPEAEEARTQWALALVEELKMQDPANIMSPTYVSLGCDRDTNLEKVYGKYYDRVLALKNQYDGENVFRYAVPRLVPLP